ncbi:FERM domain-containing protein 5-like isoform X4 [Littorina saxatilis]|uniref:FERM domain-containing protein 5-like isoform X4 n=1 Tax=Littorina saxatilis TaxID=31220 RepID=UPI0038B45BE0
MFRKRSKSDVQTEYTCSVRFLDDEPLQFTFKKDTIGQWLSDRVGEKLNLMEKDYFGLRYVDTEKQRHWLDPLKTVYKQLKGINPMVLCFRVKFYPEDPMKLHEEITRYYLFLQLRRDLHHGRLLCSPDDAVSLAAFIVQSEVGDYDPQDHPPGYISEFKMLPKQTPKLEERVMEQHKTLHGQVPSEAEGNFLKKACTLDTYGVDPHQVKFEFGEVVTAAEDQKGDQLYLGITHQGIMTFRGSRRTQLYKWAQIRRLAYEGKMFVVHVSVNEDDEAGTTKKLFNGIKKKQQPVGYKCATAPAAKYLWRCAVEQQLFFTLSTSTTAPKLRSGGTLFSRGSKFRFSGRCQTEAYAASEDIHRKEPNFARSSSLPNFARRHPSQSSRNSAHPTGSREHILNETSPEERRGYKEAAVDVPRGLSPKERKPELEVEPSPVVKAPLAHVENYAEEQLQQQQQKLQAAGTDLITSTSVATTAATATLPSRLNGQAVRDGVEGALTGAGDVDTSFDTSAYQPNMTYYEDEEEEEDSEKGKPKPSLEEQISQLDAQFHSSEQNHVPDTPTSPTPPQAVAVKKKSGGRGICCALFTSVFVALLLFAVLFYVLYFSGLKHPMLTEARGHLKFLEPTRDFVAKQAANVAKLFKK